MLGVLWYLQRRFGGRAKQATANEPIKLIGRKALGGKTQLVVVDAEGKRYVLGVSEGGVSVVDVLPQAHTDGGAHTGVMTTAPVSTLEPAAPGSFGRALELATADQLPLPAPAAPTGLRAFGLLADPAAWARVAGIARKTPSA